MVGASSESPYQLRSQLDLLALGQTGRYSRSSVKLNKMYNDQYSHGWALAYYLLAE
jgi:hypothetical protein